MRPWRRRADAIHPGYGFLVRARRVRAPVRSGEDHLYRAHCRTDCSRGRQAAGTAGAEAAGVPVAPGGAVNSVEEALAAASESESAAGQGGGRRRWAGHEAGGSLWRNCPRPWRWRAPRRRGLRRCARLPGAIRRAAAATLKCRFWGTAMGGVIHLGERDCSAQRRYQKLDRGGARARTCQRSCAKPCMRRQCASRSAWPTAARVPWNSWWTRSARAFYFLEMNARIQVEHPVTEAVTGVDLVAEQLAIADGAGLRLAQSDVRTGAAPLSVASTPKIRTMISSPVPGLVREASWPTGEGIRVDTHIAPGSRIPPYYDSLMAKIIAHGPDRTARWRGCAGASPPPASSGVSTNLAFHAIGAGRSGICGRRRGYWLCRAGAASGAPSSEGRYLMAEIQTRRDLASRWQSVSVGGAGIDTART